MPQYVVDKLTAGLNDREAALKNSRVLMLGVAYKKKVNDMRESPSVEIMEILRRKGALVDYSDPHAPIFAKMRSHSFNLESTGLNRDSLATYDAVVLATNHDKFDYELIEKYAKLIVDTRGRFRREMDNVVKA